MQKMVSNIIKAIFTKPLTIIKGTFNNIFNKHQDLASKRLKICMNCEYRVDIPVTLINTYARSAGAYQKVKQLLQMKNVK